MPDLLKILITNNSFTSRAGSELFAQEIGESLLQRGHQVAAYSNHVGELAESMAATGIEVVDDLSKLSWEPDIVHGQHHLETMTAVAHFPNVPVFYMCHGWRPWQEKPPLHPRILKYAAVDIKTLDHAVEKGVPRDLELVHNFVDLDRFVRRSPLPQRPRKALVFSNYAAESNYLPVVTQACKKAGIEVDALGALYGNMSDRPEQILGSYDLVFAKGRCSLEALATGAALIICDETGVGPMVTTANMADLRDKNFGVAAMHSEMDADVIYQEILKYNAGDAAKVTTNLREIIGINGAVEKIERLYLETIEIFRDSRINKADADRSLSAYLKEISLFIKSNEVERLHQAQMIADQERLIAGKDQILKESFQDINRLKEVVGQIDQELVRVAREKEAITNSRSWKLRNRLVGLLRLARR